MKKELLELLAKRKMSENTREYFYENIDSFDDFQLNLIYEALVAKNDEDFAIVIGKNRKKIEEMSADLKKSVHDARRELYVRAEEELNKTRPQRLEDLLRMM